MTVMILPGVRYEFTEHAKDWAADCDNHQYRMVFTPQEIHALKATFASQMLQGVVSRPVLKKGEDLSCIYFSHNNALKKNAFFVVVKYQSEEAPANYAVNFGLGYQPDATENFDEVLRLGRMHLDRVFSAPDLQSCPAHRLT